MPIDLATIQIVAGVLVSGAAWIATRKATRAWDRSRTKVRRETEAPFVRSIEERRVDAEQRALTEFRHLVRLDGSLPPVGPPRADLGAPDPAAGRAKVPSAPAAPAISPEIPSKRAEPPNSASGLVEASPGANVAPIVAPSPPQEIPLPKQRPEAADIVLRMVAAVRTRAEREASQNASMQAAAPHPQRPPTDIVSRVLANLPRPIEDAPETPPTVAGAQSIPGREAVSGLSGIFIQDTEAGGPVEARGTPSDGRATQASGDDLFNAFRLPSSRTVGGVPAPVEGREGTGPVASMRSTSASAQASWVQPGTEILIRNVRVTRGMIYVGGSLPSPRGLGNDNCLVNPAFIIARTCQPGEATGLNYWPDYAMLTSAGRRAYIDWLAGDRSDPAADIGLVFLYFYGIERRLFLDRAVSEAPMLVAEVERLVDVYRGHGSFLGYATNFLAAATLVSGQGPARVEPSAATNCQPELPLATRLHLGAVLAEDRPLNADDALLWILGAADTHLRTPGQRCFPELRRGFSTRFAEQYPRGIVVRGIRKRITASYRAASGAFTAAIPGPHEKYPDISGISTHLPELRSLLESGQTELEAYSRLLGRKPEARGTLEAAVLLPPGPLRDDVIVRATEKTRRALAPALGGKPIAAVAARTLFGVLGVALEGSAKRAPAGALNQLLSSLDALGFGIEPDRRYGGEAVALAGEVVLFEAAGGAPVDPNRLAFVRAKTTMEVAILASAIDGDVSDAEFDAVVDDARAMPGLNPAEAIRLEAFVWTLRNRANDGGALRRAAGLALEARWAIARAAITAVLSDGYASRAEIAFLERLHKTLGLPHEAVHSALHQGAGGNAGAFRASASPVPKGAAQQGIALDAERLSRIRQETIQVSSLLSNIFAEEPDGEQAEADGPPAPRPPPEVATRFDGLDGAHGTLLEAVLATGGMPMAEFETRAKGQRLFADGAIETINDWAFDRYGELIVETEGDTVAVADHLRADLQGT